MTFIILGLVFGLACASIGGELFVRGSVGLATKFRLPAGLVGATIAAFATSSPEASVSVNAALAGTPNIALGDALGSNVVNVGLVLGVALVLKPLMTRPDGLLNLVFAGIAPVLTAFLIMDGKLSRFDGAVLLTTFLSWLAIVVRSALKDRAQRSDTVPEAGVTITRLIVDNLGGLVLLILAGRSIVYAAKEITSTFGLDPFIIGATLVAVGTSIPELATVIISRLRGHDEIGLGAILGSNIFNNLFIVPIAVLLRPFEINWGEVVIGLFFGFVLVLLTIPGRTRILTVARGGLLLAIYAAYVASFLLL